MRLTSTEINSTENTPPPSRIAPVNQTRRILRRVGQSVLLIAILWLTISAGLLVAIYGYGNQRSEQTADTIIVLGSGLRRDGRPGDALYRRSRWAAELYAEGYAPNIICTGGLTPGYPRSEASACREVLIEHGVPPEVILLEEHSRSTEENAINSRAMMDAQGWQDAVLVSDSFHMLRGQWIFETQGLTVYPNPVPRNWVRATWYIQFSIRETLALQWQVFKEVLDLPVTYVPVG